jgi:hypothetical protein
MTMRTDFLVAALAIALSGCVPGPSEAEAQTEANSNQSGSAIETVDVTALSDRAIEDQMSCRSSPSPRKALMALLKNKQIKESGDGWDGAEYYKPTRPMKLFGFSVLRITGWDQSPHRGKDIFWYAGSGTAPPTHIEVKVRGGQEEVKQELIARELDPSLINELDSDSSATILICYEK